MAKMNLQYDVLNYTPASASPVESNFNRIEQHINQEVIERGGTVSMAAQLKLIGNPIAALDAAPKQYVDQMLPIGIIMLYGGTGAPPGGRWALCNGAQLEAVTYPDLYDIVGSKFSPAGTPAGRFNLPNLQGRTVIGSDANNPPGTIGGSGDGALVAHTHSLSNVATGTPGQGHTHSIPAGGGGAHTHSFDVATLGASVRHQHNYIAPGLLRASGKDTGDDVIRLAIAEDGAPSIGVRDVVGTQAVQLTGPDTPDHGHSVNGTTYAAGSSGGGGGTSGSDTPGHIHLLTGTTASTGGASTGNNLPPYVAMPYIIRIL